MHSTIYLPSHLSHDEITRMRIQTYVSQLSSGLNGTLNLLQHPETRLHQIQYTASTRDNTYTVHITLTETRLHHWETTHLQSTYTGPNTHPVDPELYRKNTEFIQTCLHTNDIPHHLHIATALLHPQNPILRQYTQFEDIINEAHHGELPLGFHLIRDNKTIIGVTPDRRAYTHCTDLDLYEPLRPLYVTTTEELLENALHNLYIPHRPLLP